MDYRRPAPEYWALQTPKFIRPFNSECFERFANQVSNDRGAGIIKIVIIIAITSIGMVITSPDIVNFKKTISKTQ